jgi:thiol-disulfide isomerase/thioredoxin
MKISRLLNLILLGILLSSAIPIQAQIASLSKEKPSWGEKIKISYEPAAEKAAFLPGDEVFVVFFVSWEDSSEQTWQKLEPDNGLLSCQMKIERGMSYLTLYFITKEAWDKNARVSAMILDTKGKPAKGAFQGQMLASGPDKYQDFFQQEREAHPDNFAVFRDKWFLAGAFDKKNQLTIIKQDMAELSKQKEEPIDLLYTLSYGHLVQGNEAAGRRILEQMIDKDPQSYYTGYAIRNYEYMVFSKQVKGEGSDDVDRLKLDLFKKTPKTSFARDNCINFAGEEDISLKTIQAVCKPWIKDEPDNPLPYYALAQVLSRDKRKLKKAAEAIEQAISHTLEGSLRLYSDVSGVMSEMYLPRFYKLSAEIQMQAGNIARALADIHSAKALLKETKGEYFMAEAEIWREIGQFHKAETALLTAHSLGSEEALGALREIYQQRHTDLNGFDAYLAEKQTKAASADSQEKPPAPPFQVETLAGNKLDLEKLKGKVVVLNFWFIGCAPCRVEIPGLNTLVEEYRDKDVVFIAFALDKAPKLKEFLQEKPFNYQIVPEGNELASAYGVKVFPTHIIINPQGQIEYFLTGGNETRHEQLRPLIDNLL